MVTAIILEANMAKPTMQVAKVPDEMRVVRFWFGTASNHGRRRVRERHSLELKSVVC